MRAQTAPQSEISTDWRIHNLPADTTRATASKAAIVPSNNPNNAQCNVLTEVIVVMIGGGSAPTPTVLTVAVIDGDSGGTDYVWGPHVFAIPAVAGAQAVLGATGLYRRGTPGRAMTVEFSATGGANTRQSVEAAGTTAP